MKLLITLLTITLLLQSCSSFKKYERLLVEYKRINGENIDVYYAGREPMTRYTMEVRVNNSERPVWVSDRYDYLQSSELINNTTLKLMLLDTTEVSQDKPVMILVVVR